VALGVVAAATAGAQQGADRDPSPPGALDFDDPYFKREMERRMFESAAGKAPVRRDLRDPVEKPAPQERFSKDELAEAREAERRRKERRQSPEASEERKRSRDAYRGKRGRDALEVARDRQRAFVEAPAWKPLELGPNDALRAFTGDFTALIDRRGADGKSQRLLAQSDLPMRSKVGEGAQRPADMTLERRGNAYEPKNPLVPTRVAADPEAGAEVSGLRIRPDGGGEGAQVVEDKLFFANAGQDTDLIVTPQPQGLQFAWQLRSAESPEQRSLQLDLPAGAELRSDRDGGASVVRADKLLFAIRPPSAWDADGERIPVSYRVEGATLRVDVAHRGGDWAYPLLVDPEVIDQYSLNLDGSPRYQCNDFSVGDDFGVGGWQWSQVVRSGSSFGWDEDANPYPGWQNCDLGLRIYAPTDRAYDAGNFGQWTQWAFRNSYIEAAHFRATHQASSSCIKEALFEYTWPNGSARNNWSAGRWWHPPDYNPPEGTSPWFSRQGDPSAPNYRGDPCHGMGGNAKHHRPDAPGRHNAMVFRLMLTGQPSGTVPASELNGALLYLGDYDTPATTVSHSGLPSGWTRRATPTVSIRGREPDPGLGVRWFDLYRPVTGGGNYPGNPGYQVDQRDMGCSGAVHSRCDDDLTQSFSYDTNTMPEGPQALYADSWDALGKQSNVPAWAVKVDRSGPGITPSGSLYDGRNRDDDHRNEGLYDADHHVTVTASEPSGRSGVKSIEILIDGQRKAYVTDQCSNDTQCPDTQALKFTLQADDYSDGDHQVKIVSRDLAGNSTERNWAITVDRRGDIYKAQKYLELEPDQYGPESDVQWGRLGTHQARAEDDEAVTTRTTVEENGHRFDEVRSASKLASQRDEETGDTDPNADESYEVTRGYDENDPDLDVVADILAPATEEEGQAPAATGSLHGELKPWQTRPPASGTTYQRYDSTGDYDDPETGEPIEGRVERFVDAKTKMPFKEVVRDQHTGGLLLTLYYSYSRSRLAGSELPPDFFSIGKPVRTGMEQNTSANGNRRIRQMRDEETGATFEPYYLGETLGLITRSFALAGSDILHQRIALETAVADEEPDPEPGEDVAPSPGRTAPVTSVDAYYQPAFSPLSDGFKPGVETSDAPLWVSSMSGGSSEAAAWRREYVEQAEAIATDPTDPETGKGGVVPVTVGATPATAYVIPLDDTEKTSALMDVRGTTIRVEGAFDLTEISAIAQRLEVF
jgi:hypothetical protein